MKTTLETTILSNLNLSAKSTNFLKDKNMTNKIQKLNQQIEQIKSLNEAICYQEKEIKLAIDTFQCSEKIKRFLFRATEYYVRDASREIDVLDELLHSEDLNLQNLKEGSTINVNAFCKFKYCKKASKNLNKDETRLILKFKRGTHEIHIICNQNQVVTRIFY